MSTSWVAFAYAIELSLATFSATAAYAYQYVLTTGAPMHLSPAGQQAVATIRDEARTLAASSLDFFALEEQLDALAARFRAVIDEELSPVGGDRALVKAVDHADAGS
jgi:hypothetical protein